jgi:hypothetical protein
MAITEALGKAMTSLGVAANTYHGSKYDRAKEMKEKTQKKVKAVTMAEFKARLDKGISLGYKTAIEKFLSDNLSDSLTLDNMPESYVPNLDKLFTECMDSFKKDEPVAEKPKNEPVPVTEIKDLPEDRQNPFTPYAKGGENVKAKTETKTESKTVFFAPGQPVDAKFTEEKTETPTEDVTAKLKESSGKLRDAYATKIAELKTRAQCEGLCKELASKAGEFIEIDRNILKASFASKRDEILATLPKTEAKTEKPADTEKTAFKVGDKVVVRTKPEGAVVMQGEITVIKTVDNKPAAVLKGHPMPVFLANCYLK